MDHQAPGILITYFFYAIALTIPASIILLYWYRRAILRGMRAVSEELTASSESQNVAARAEAGKRDGTSVMRRLVIVYTLAGAAAAAVIAAMFLASPGIEFSAFRAFVVWYAYCWPIGPTLAALLALPQRKALLAFALYALAGVALVLLWSLVSLFVLGKSDTTPFANAGYFLLFLVSEAWLPYLLIVTTANRRLRSVSPLVLAGLLVFSFSGLILWQAFVAAFDNPAWRSALLYFGANTYHLLFMVMVAALPVGYMCWRLLRWLGERYEDKSFSDVQLLVDIWWLMIIFWECASLASNFGWRALFGLLAFVVYRGVVELGLKLWQIGYALPGESRLLLLRVFGFQRRTEKLFDAIGARWRLEGSVKMIAGADLAMRTIDPGDVIAFTAGRLKHLFVQDEGDLKQRLARLDQMSDPDGRFRVIEFFCHDNTWRPTLRALARTSDFVLMDLRGFSQANSGCLFELEQLAQHGLLARTLFVVDETTDVPLLESTLAQQAGGSLKLNLAHAKASSPAEFSRIYGALQALA
ncbi:MAG TPA: hypothetical protein VFH21_06050 [Burkholderiales bacterium]|nr:hypothetical protein [Burkholderiales bacterium]